MIQILTVYGPLLLQAMGQTLLLALAPLLLAAAFVEAYVTPAVAAWFL